MPHIRVNGVNLYYEFQGPEKGPLVILNNGVFMNTTSWAFQLPDLARHHRVLLYDMRGQGRSEHPDGEYSLELHAQDLVALMDALGLGQAHMVGTSRWHSPKMAPPSFLISEGVFSQLDVFVSNLPSFCNSRYCSSVKSSMPMASAIFMALSFGLFSFLDSSASRS